MSESCHPSLGHSDDDQALLGFGSGLQWINLDSSNELRQMYVFGGLG